MTTDPGNSASDSHALDTPASRSALVRSWCDRAGFALTGVCMATPSEFPERMRAWIASGRHGALDWFPRTTEARLDPNAVLEGAVSCVMVCDLYATRHARPEAPMPGVGRVARYARGRDYHTVIKKRLHTVCDRMLEHWPGAKARAFVDTAPVPEREYARRAGLGWIGKNTMLIHPRLGSYTLLGGILTTLDLSPTDESDMVSDHCGTCTRCIDACPTEAIDLDDQGRGRINARSCLSALTIEQREPVDPAYHEKFGDWLFGCDVCQEVCPHNSARADGVDVGVTHDAYHERRAGFDLLDVLNWTADDRRAAFGTSAMKRATLGMMHRNASILLGRGNGAQLDRDAAADANSGSSPKTSDDRTA